MSAQFLSPPAACRFLFDEYGVKRTPATLAKQRVTGGNTPPYRKVNRNIYYCVADLRDWADAALSPSYRSTSDRTPVAEYNFPIAGECEDRLSLTRLVGPPSASVPPPRKRGRPRKASGTEVRP
jgi:hypothetical protein